MLSHAVTLLTIASILGHALLGCCGHHVHEQDGLAHEHCGRSHQHADEAHATGHDHDHVAATTVEEAPRPLVLHSHWGSSPLADGTHDHDEDMCGEPPCSYVMPDVSQLVNAGDLPATFLAPDILSRNPAETLLFAHCTALEISPHDPHRDSARGRSLLGVWLL
jgi:hypothetical protein